MSFDLSGDWDAYRLPPWHISELSLGIISVGAIMVFRFLFRFVTSSAAQRYAEECHPQTKPPDCFAKLSSSEQYIVVHKVFSVDEIMKRYQLSEEDANSILRVATDRRRLGEAKHKFQDVAYKTVICSFLTIIGALLFIFKLPFFTDFASTWEGVVDRGDGAQSFNTWMFLLYSMELGYHLQGAILQFFDTVRKDFWAMVIHHWVTVALIIGSWAYRYMRTGTVVMVIHDNTDMVLRLAKLCDYMHYDTLKDVFFLTFALLWFVFRNVIFSWFTFSNVIYSPTFSKENQSYWVLFGLLCLLEVLHIYWFTFIGAALFRVFCHKDTIGDTRSMSESDGENLKKKGHGD